MESSTEPGASGSGLRTAGFLVTVLGVLLAGVGAALTWVTVGIETVDALDTVTKGLDVWDGIVVLVCAVAMLAGVLASRLVSSGRARRGFGGLVIAAGFVASAVAGAFVMTATARFDPVDDDRLVTAIAEAAGVEPSEVQASIDETLGEIGAFTRVGPGPYLAIVGGLAGAIGGVLVLAWASRVPDASDP